MYNDALSVEYDNDRSYIYIQFIIHPYKSVILSLCLKFNF